ncbi:MAG: MEKHLA domain-containing protein [Gammaproteobacteria bacterium]
MLLFDSYRRWTGESLPVASSSAGELAEQLFNAPFGLMSHDTNTDPLITYGNRTALDLWETDWAHFTGTPSRQTAEPGLREERARLLKEVSEQGFSSGYRGIRISFNGRRFEILQATVWNLLDDQGRMLGQAAFIPSWKAIG